MLEFIVNEGELKEDFTTVCEKGLNEITSLNYGHLDLDRVRKDNEEYY